MKIESNRVKINAPAEKTYQLVSNFNNFGASLPPEVKNWKSTENNCSFEVSGMAKINIDIIDKVPFESVTYKVSANQPIEMVLIGKIQAELDFCFAQIFLDAEVPTALALMMKKPLENFINVLVNKVKEVAES